MSVPVTRTSPAPNRLGRYLLHSRLAVGGMAEVWLARQEGPAGFAKELVIKKILDFLAADQVFVEMFLDEARLAALLNHPNIVQIFELSEHDGDYFLVMEYLRGRTLREVMRRCEETKTSLPYGVVAYIAACACEGLHYAHELSDANGKPLGIVHRDVSPDNVFVTFDGQVKVLDFGIAKAATNSGLTEPGTLKGKYAYMSPEQIRGQKLDRRSDVHGMGVVLYELLTGARPFDATSELALMNAIVDEDPKPIRQLKSQVPKPLAAAVHRALAKQPAERHPTARALGQELSSWMRDEDPSGQPEAARVMARLFPEQGPTRDVPMEPTAPRHARSLSSRVARSLKARPVQIGLGAGLVSLALSIGIVVAAIGRAPPPATAPPVAAPAAGAPAMPHEGASEAEEGRPAAPRRISLTEQVLQAERSTPPAASPGAATAPAGTGSTGAPARGSAAAAPKPASAPARGAAATAGKGKLDVRVNPWAEVYVDGNSLGMTPFPPVELSTGTHVVRLVNEQIAVQRELKTEVRRDKTTTLRVDLLE